jgi:TetR/AcrR family transcriptional regulator, tetracycline repressor protein
MGRGTETKQREKLSRDRVIDAALRVMDLDGLEAVSMRRIAREVGVEAMSLYNHVRDKDDLLEGIRLRVFSEFVFPELDPNDPYENGRRVAHSWRNLLEAHPNMLELLAEDHEPPSSLEAFAAMEVALAVLRSMGVPDDEMVQVFHAFGGYIQGYTMMEHQMDFQKHGGPAGLAELARRIDASQLPCVAAALPYMADCDLDAQFSLGLDLMLEGMRARYGTT